MDVYRIVLVALLVPGLLAQCPQDRIVQGVTCAECPSGSTCQRGRCCWNEQEAVSSPCTYPMTRGDTFVTCDLPGQGRGQGQGQVCPGSCHTCQSLPGMDVGLCCPQTQRPNCASASPEQVAFERQIERIRSSGSGTGSSSFDRMSTGSPSFNSMSTGSSGTGTAERRPDIFQNSIQTGLGREPDRRAPVFTPPPRDTRPVSRDRDSGRRMMMGPGGNMPPGRRGPSGPCGVDIRPLGTCRMGLFRPPCPRGFQCVPYGFLGACCPIGAGPSPRARFDQRIEPRGARNSLDRFGNRPGTGNFRNERRAGPSSADGQLSGRSSDRRRTGGGASSGTAGSTSSRDFERMLFGPPPDETFPGGPIDSANTPRGKFIHYLDNGVKPK